jgi:hypothetical protein
MSSNVIGLLVILLTSLAAPAHPDADLDRAQAWLDGLKMDGISRLVAKTPPPFPGTVLVDRQAFEWPTDQTQFILPDADLLRNTREINRAVLECREMLILVVEIRAGDQVLSRGIEMPADYPMVLPDQTRSLETHRQESLTRLLKQRPHSAVALYDTYFVEGIIRKMRGEPPVYDKARLEATLGRIDNRIDCADFDLAFALRFCRLGAGTDADRQRIRESALRFRYWRTEPGNDVMVFHGENHPMLFHSDQLIAGNLWPDDVFTNSGLKGREQAILGKQQCLDYLEKLESEGYEEFLSTTYWPITASALMNLVDFSDDMNISRRAARQVDRIHRMMAEHCFDGVMIGPQGRTYRRLLYPQMLTSQAMMSYASPRAVEAFDPWVIFTASSPHYRIPSGLDTLMDSPVRKQYREAYLHINLNKTHEYMLSSIEISPAKGPSYPQQTTPGGRGYQWAKYLFPGGKGYQQHIWHAALARDCHVFTTHPSSNADRGDHTPGYWAGNSTFPRQTQNGNMLMQIFSIPQDHPIQFTHAYWPSKSFDQEQRGGHWMFGRRNKGYIALWCSTTPVKHDDVLSNSELRASGGKTAWVCICSGESESGDFNTFISSCERLNPHFNTETLTLAIRGRETLSWHDGSKDPSE